MSKNILKNIAELCRIHFSQEEEEKLNENLLSILKYVEQLKEVDTSNVAPCNHVLEEIANVTRNDVAGTPMARELFLANAPDQIGGMIRVPPVIKKT